jgi:hypothetical protein
MAAGSTYTPLATNTLGTAVASVTFSSISGAYTDLVIICTGDGVGNTGIGMQYNGDNGNNYSATFLEGSGTAAESERQSSTNYVRVAWNSIWDTTTRSTIIINIQNYSNATTYKTSINRSNNSARYVEAIVGLWRNTNAITSVTLTGVSNNLAVGSTFTLYGIAAA